jgi:hypothetical protein
LILLHLIVCILCVLRHRDQNVRADSRRRLARLAPAENIKARIIINATATPTATPTPAAMAIVCGLELEE